MRPLIVLGCLVALSCESVMPAPFETPAPASLPLHACHIDGLAEAVRCGVHEVSEDRAAGASRRLGIHVAVLPALRRRAEPDPLFLLAGGPGQGARGMAPAAARYFRDVRRQRDIVLVDLRGTGASHALACDAGADEIAALSEDAATATRRCAIALDADVRYYTHREALADLDDVRQRLGYARINLWGGSWGTRAALLYALRYPDSTRSVVLDGAVPLAMAFPSSASTDAQAALDALVAACAAEARCRDTYPDPAADLDHFSRRFAGGTFTVDLRHPRTHQPVRVPLSYGTAMGIVRGALYTPRDAAAVLWIVREGAAGNFAPLLAQYLRTAAVATDDMALGATFSILCSEDLPRVTTRDFAADAGGSRFGTTDADTWRSRCAAWPAGRGSDVPDDAVSPVPALILSGGHDPVTPPRWGEIMARHFAHARHVIVPNAAHNASFSGCLADLIARFLSAGRGDALEDACAGDVGWPPFVVSVAGSRP